MASQALQSYPQNLPLINVSENAQVAITSASVIAFATFLVPSLISVYLPNLFFLILYQLISIFLPTFVVVYIFMENNQQIFDEVADIAHNISPIAYNIHYALTTTLQYANAYPKITLATYTSYILRPWIIRLIHPFFKKIR